MDKVCNAKIMFLVLFILSSLNLCNIHVFLAIDIVLEFERINEKTSYNISSLPSSVEYISLNVIC